MISCAPPAGAERRRTFWTTQPNACGVVGSCGAECGVVGLALTQGNCGRQGCSCCPSPADRPDCPPASRPPAPRTFVTTDWVRSLVLNILLTDGKSPNSKCGFRPGGQGGHWSESFRKDGQKIGSLVRKIPKSPGVRESVALVRATLLSELSRLVTVGIAKSVAVDAQYLGANTMRADIDILAPDGTTVRVGMTGDRNANAWAWR